MTPLLAQGLRADRSFERIYRRHVGDVYRYALAVLRNPADAEDVAQTTFMNAYRAYAGGERPRQPHNWLIAIAHNVCRQRFRQSQRRPQEVAYDDNVGEWVEDDERGPSADDLRRALSHLAFNQRAALVMRELEGRSYVEIGEILGLTVSAVETLIFRARRALREQLEGSLTCAEAERALSLEADRRLPRAERGPLRAHLRECKDCAAAARRQRAQRSAWKALGALPVPASLSSLFGGGGAALGVKAAAVAASAIAAGGIGLAGERHFTVHPANAKRHPATPRAPTKVKPAVEAPVAATATPTAAAVSHPSFAVAVHPAARHGRQGGGSDENSGGSGSGSAQHRQYDGQHENGGPALTHERQNLQQEAGNGAQGEHGAVAGDSHRASSGDGAVGQDTVQRGDGGQGSQGGHDSGNGGGMTEGRRGNDGSQAQSEGGRPGARLSDTSAPLQQQGEH
jgi:RNA polymerase sigma factor (sigma-70 family)